MKVIDINEGEKIAYEVSGTKITFGDDELMVNLKKQQKSCPVHIDISADVYGALSMGVGDYYVAQIDIPAFTYPEPEEPVEGVDPAPLEPLPLDMDEVTLTLWAI